MRNRDAYRPRCRRIILSVPAAPARSAFLLSHLTTLAGTVAVQAGTQLLVFASGVIAVRYLPIEQYAYYTLANAALGMAAALSDSGMTAAITGQCGKVWQQPDRLGAVLSTGLALRRNVSLLCLALLAPILLWLAQRQGSSVSQAFLLCVSVAPVFLLTTSSAILEIPLRLHQRLRQLQVMQLAAAVTRLACIALMSVVYPVAWLAVLSSFPAFWLFNRRLRERSSALAHLDASRDDEARKRITAQVFRTLPGAIYFVFAGQLTVLLISLFGTTEGVAQVGALGRIATIVSFLILVFNMIATPRYARIPETETRKLLRVYLLMMGGLAAACLATVLCAWLAPRAVLFILGAKYDSLTSEVVVAVASGAVAVLSAAASGMAAVRGTVVSPFVSIPPSIAIQVLLVFLLPLDSVASMFWMNIALSSVHLIANVTYFVRRLAS
jgi:O-antigen/teichoic acid export membrane protein